MLIRPVVYDSIVYVSDVGNGRITRWTLRSDSLVYLGQSRTPIPLAPSLCGIRGELFSLQYRAGGVIQRALLDGTITASFGRPFYEGQGIDPVFTTGGLIACDAANAVVYVTEVPVVRKYSAATGELLWEVRIPGIIPPEVTRDPRTGLPRYRRPAGSLNAGVVSIVPAPIDRVLLQVGVIVPRVMAFTRNDVLDVETIIYDARNGAVLGRRRDLPRLDHASGDYVYSHTDDPFPRVQIYRWR